jgi:hypothetical protein
MERVPTLDVSTLHNIQRSKEVKQMHIFNLILTRVHYRISTVANSNDAECCFYQIPNMSVGLPLFDSFKCCSYVIYRLREEGYAINYIHPNYMFINWALDAIDPTRLRKIQQKQVPRMPAIQRTPAVLNTSAQRIPEKQKQVTIIPEYQSTGRLFKRDPGPPPPVVSKNPFYGRRFHQGGV